MKKLKIGLFGATGRMGSEIAKISETTKNIELSFTVGRNANTQKLKCDVVVDFSSADGLVAALNYAVKENIPLVSGSTGLSKKDLAQLKAASKKIPVLWAPNMSPGIAAVKKAVEGLYGIKQYSFHIEEWHHANKMDSPSGTAIALSDKLKSVLKKDKISTHSIRAGGIFGIHKIYAIGESEYVEIAHHALNRKVFAEGAVAAAKWIQGKRPGLYNMEDVIS